MKDTSPIDGKCSNIAATFTMVPVPHTMWRLLTSLALLAVVVPGADGGYPNAAAKPLLAEVKGMFDHGYEGYLKQVCVCAVYRSTNNNIFLFFSFFQSFSYPSLLLFIAFLYWMFLRSCFFLDSGCRFQGLRSCSIRCVPWF